MNGIKPVIEVIRPAVREGSLQWAKRQILTHGAEVVLHEDQFGEPLATLRVKDSLRTELMTAPLDEDGSLRVLDSEARQNTSAHYTGRMLSLPAISYLLTLMSEEAIQKRYMEDDQE